jgi:hypothetical protein
VKIFLEKWRLAVVAVLRFAGVFSIRKKAPKLIICALFYDINLVSRQGEEFSLSPFSPSFRMVGLTLDP